MAIQITYLNGATEIIPNAKGARDNYLNGTFDFYDEDGKLLKQIKMDERIEWRPTPEPEND